VRGVAIRVGRSDDFARLIERIGILGTGTRVRRSRRIQGGFGLEDESRLSGVAACVRLIDLNRSIQVHEKIFASLNGCLQHV